MAPLVVCPYVPGMLRDETTRALEECGQPWLIVPLDPGWPGAYAEAVAYIWQLPGDLIIVEQDVAPTPEQITGLVDCPGDWCGYTYTGRWDGQAGTLGCVKFSAQLRSWHHRLPQRVLHDSRRPRRWVRWESVDTLMRNSLTHHGHRWHEHHPAVNHLERQTQL